MNETENKEVCKAQQLLVSNGDSYTFYCDLDLNHTCRPHYDNEANTYWFEGTVNNATATA